jgi:hypothetical protein
MVRRGSTVRVRQRALQKRRKSALSRSDGLALCRTCGGYGAVYGAFALGTRLLRVRTPGEASRSRRRELQRDCGAWRAQAVDLRFAPWPHVRACAPVPPRPASLPSPASRSEVLTAPDGATRGASASTRQANGSRDTTAGATRGQSPVDNRLLCLLTRTPALSSNRSSGSRSGPSPAGRTACSALMVTE